MEENPVNEKPNIKTLTIIPCEDNIDLENFDPCESNEDFTEIDLAILLKQEAAKLLEQKKKEEETQEPIFTKEEEAKLQEIKAIAQRKHEAIAQYDETAKSRILQKIEDWNQNEKDAENEGERNLKEVFEGIDQEEKEIKEQGDIGEEKQGTIYQTENEIQIKGENDFLEYNQEEERQLKDADTIQEQSIESENDVLLYEKGSDTSKVDAAVWQNSTSSHSFHDSEDSEEEKYLPEGRKTKRRICKKVIKNPFFTNRLQFQSQQLCPPPLTPPPQKLPPVPEVDSVGSIVCHKGDKKKKLRKKRESGLSVTATITIKKPKNIFKASDSKKNSNSNNIKKRDEEKVTKKVKAKNEKRNENFQRKNIKKESDKKDTSMKKLDEKTEKPEKKEKDTQNDEQSEGAKAQKVDKNEKQEKFEKEETAKRGSASEKAESRGTSNEKTLDEKEENHTDKEVQYNYETEIGTEEKPGIEEVTDDNMSLKFEKQGSKEEGKKDAFGESISKESEQSTDSRMESVDGKSAEETTKETPRKERLPSRRKHCERKERLPCRKKVSDISISLLPPQIPPLQRDLPATCPRNIPEFQRQVYMANKNKGKMCKKRLDKNKSKAK